MLQGLIGWAVTFIHINCIAYVLFDVNLIKSCTQNISLLHLWPGFLLFMLLFRTIFCYILQCLKKNLKTLLVLLHFFTIKNFWAIGFVNCDMVYKVLICKEPLKEFTKLSNYLILFSYCLVNVLCFEAQIFFYFMVILSR